MVLGHPNHMEKNEVSPSHKLLEFNTRWVR